MKLFADQEFCIEGIGSWIVVNAAKYGCQFTTDDGCKTIVVWKRQVEQFNLEKGFYIPRPLVLIRHVFEVKVRKKAVYTHYLYNPDEEAQRVHYTDPLVFVGVSKMEVTTDTVSVRRPKCQS